MLTTEHVDPVLRNRAKTDRLALHEEAGPLLRAALAKHIDPTEGVPDRIRRLAAGLPTTARRDVILWAELAEEHPDKADRALAFALWDAKVRPELARKAARRAAVVVSVLDEILRVLRPGMTLIDGWLVDARGRTVARVDCEGRPGMPFVDLRRLDAFLTEAATDLGRVAAFRLVWWLIREAHEREEIRVEGGWVELCRILGGKADSRAGAQLKRLVLLLERVRFTWPHGEGPLFRLDYDDGKSGPGSRTWVAFTPQPPIMPGYAHGIDRRKRKLVPLVDLPVLTGQRRDHGAAYALALAVWRELRLSARDCVNFGGALLDWQALAVAAGCPRPTAERLREEWRGSWLTVTEAGRWTLADPEARAFLEDSGRREMAASERGKTSARKRRMGREKS